MIPGTRSQLPNFENFCSGRIFLPDVFAGPVILAVKTKTEPGDEEAKPTDEIVELTGVSSHVGVGELRVDVDIFIEKISELPKDQRERLLDMTIAEHKAEIARLEEELRICCENI